MQMRTRHWRDLFKVVIREGKPRMLESKRKAIIFFIIAVVLALLTGFLVMQKVQALNSNLGTMVQVYEAKNDIASRQVITPNDVTTTEIPKKYVTDEHITNAEDLVNKVSVVPLSSGDVITKNTLKEASAVTEEDSRLVTIMRSDNVTFDEQLVALDRVDIVVSEDVDGKKETNVFMKDVKVARVAEQDGEFSGIQVEIPFDQVPELIHKQNYAESFRVIKSNVGQMEATDEEQPAEETQDETTEQTQEQSVEEQPEKQEDRKQEEKKEDKKQEEKK